MAVNAHQPLQFIDPEQLVQVKDLHLMARTVVEGFLAGYHRSPRYGSSIEFAQYRPYTQGDDPRFVDWDLYARTDRLHVKQFQDETNLRCTLLLDASASMGYASGTVGKFQYARMLAACLAVILSRQKDAVGLIVYDDAVRAYIPPKATPRHAYRLLIELDNQQPSRRTDTAGTLRYLGDVIQPRGMVALISDLLHPAGEMIENLKSLQARKHDLMVFQISDPAEQTFPFDRSVTLIDTEEDDEQYVVPAAAREDYLKNRNAHFSRIRQECLAAEADYEEFVTSEPLDRALRFFIERRNALLMATSARRNRPHSGGR